MNTFRRIFILFMFFNQIGFSQINAEELRPDTKKPGTYFTLGLQGSFKAGNSEYIDTKSSYKIEYIDEKYTVFSVGDLEFKEALDNKKIAHGGNAHLRFVQKLSSKFYGEAFTQAEYDEFRSLNQRYLGGGGLRLELMNKYLNDDSTASVSFYASVGAMFEFEEHNIINTIEISRLLRLTNYISLNAVLSKNFSISFVTYYQPDSENFHDYRILCDLDLKSQISSVFSFLTSVQYYYDNEPAFSVKEYDLDISTGIQITF